MIGGVGNVQQNVIRAITGIMESRWIGGSGTRVCNIKEKKEKRKERKKLEIKPNQNRSFTSPSPLRPLLDVTSSRHLRKLSSSASRARSTFRNLPSENEELLQPMVCPLLYFYPVCKSQLFHLLAPTPTPCARMYERAERAVLSFSRPFCSPMSLLEMNERLSGYLGCSVQYDSDFPGEFSSIYYLLRVRAYIVRACVINNILVGIRASTLSKQTNKQTPINHHT